MFSMTSDSVSSDTSANATQHEIETLVLDTGPIIKNLCSPQSLLSKSANLVTLPSVVSEIRDQATRARFDTLWSPFLSYRTPTNASVKYVADFARKTGDYGVLGTTDLQVLALTYEIECEKLGGAEQFLKYWKEKEEQRTQEQAKKGRSRRRGGRKSSTKASISTVESVKDSDKDIPSEEDGWTTVPVSRGRRKQTADNPGVPESQKLAESNSEAPRTSDNLGSQPTPEENEIEVVSDDDDDEGDWITPDNIDIHLEANETTVTSTVKAAPISTACCTTDFAMQNVLLQLHIHLFSPTTMSRITSVKSHVLRCHACFKVVREMDRQFCPSCGQPTLTKVTCSTDANGNFRIHLKKNWQWNNRGNVFSMSKPQHGTASMKGVRENIVLSEDQKEYEKAVKDSRKHKERDLMDIDYLPGLLTGERLGHGGNPKVGAGRNVNASKRRPK